MSLSSNEKIISLDGDGSLLMNLGTLATINRENPKNLIVLVYDNEMWGQTGRQATHTSTGTELVEVAQGCGIEKTQLVDDLESLSEVFDRALTEDGPWFIVAKIDETDYLPVPTPEPEFTLYRFRNSFM